MRLDQVCLGIDYEIIQGSIETEITGICYDSRRVSPGNLFVCIVGQKTDGHQYAHQAVQSGAAAVLAERKIEVGSQGVLLLTGDTRAGLAKAAANFYGHPSRQLRVIGVTGTNGKTTTTHLIQAILNEYHKLTGIMGTLYAKFGDITREYGHTTPESADIQEFFRLVADRGAEYVVMEVSSHALDLNRVDAIQFGAAIFTNLTQDHLDYHKTMENYRQAKLKLFQMVEAKPGNFSVVNMDDPSAPYFVEASPVPCYTYGINSAADVRAVDIQNSLKGTQFKVLFEDQSFTVTMKLIGGFSVYNALAAITYALAEKIPVSVIQQALAGIKGVAGRFEQVDLGQDYTVVVDYAHTPDGLENILRTARELTGNRLITVFGCGGDRDRTKRPLMGEIAGRYSDFCIVTSDNPRTEDPQAIIDDILPGLNRVKTSRYAVVPDRREAIRHAINIAKSGDLVVIAGKGHETYQLVMGQVLDFDDRLVAAEMIKEKM
ncbi:MAG TPA: UDP-N-acetylmuramoyl-L-alanyl-D-glutamate--2,6-diaminopimelate ligase [Syntrophomonadaceae bacterium]|nr:UDP-N-acetylmuramoyl-L-alanyl-D-glutamate--2,6-diaminopimelate ligase [Syntrophomonadaceae bacterium]HOQ08734.1 UDP-N-acetylmuramoyl-L-alanyl-D-glutamate--2,6-diaminopimelate ligase [Syntrophomonadaceae bacterium]HPU47846.1 UDP-N-acetylmuramoyl-L-alanyl-D-glutamate--2,6-diaminopimelate ligase [Syntrophomonadaceae bacterium]